jgi:hypothetical protein
MSQLHIEVEVARRKDYPESDRDERQREAEYNARLEASQDPKSQWRENRGYPEKRACNSATRLAANLFRIKPQFGVS